MGLSCQWRTQRWGWCLSSILTQKYQGVPPRPTGVVSRSRFSGEWGLAPPPSSKEVPSLQCQWRPHGEQSSGIPTPSIQGGISEGLTKSMDFHPHPAVMRIPSPHTYTSVSINRAKWGTWISMFTWQCSSSLLLCWRNVYLTLVKWQNCGNGGQIRGFKRLK